MRKSKLLACAALAAACAAVFGLSFAFLGEKESADAASAHTVQMGMEDFDERGYVLTMTDKTKQHSVEYHSFADGKAPSLAGQTGIALRVKNLSSSVFVIKQVELFRKDSTLVISPYKFDAIKTLRQDGLTGEIAPVSNLREIRIPAEFDGMLLLDFAQMTVLRPSTASEWNWTNTEHLSDSSADADFHFPDWELEAITYWTPSNTTETGAELMVGAHAAYTQTADGGYTFGEAVYADQTQFTPSGADTAFGHSAVTSYTVNAEGDEHVTVGAQGVRVPYGYTYTLPATFEAGYRQGTVTVDGEEQSSLRIANNSKENKTVQVNVMSRKHALDGSAYLLDPDDNDTASANFGGSLPFASPLSPVGADGIYLRIRNLRSEVYTLNTVYINEANNVQYSALNTLYTFVGTDGTVTTDRASSGATVNNRTMRIPANFDGYVLIPFTELVRTRVDGTYDWSKREGDKLRSPSTDPWTDLPHGDLLSVQLYFSKGIKAGTGELVFGDAGTYTGTGADFAVREASALKVSGPLTLNGGNTAVSAFPTAETTVTLQINGKTAASDESLDLGTDSTQFTLTYGEILRLAPVAKLGYVLSRTEVKGEGVDELLEGTFVNRYKEGKAITLNFITEESMQVTVSEEEISLAGVAALKVHVDNREGEEIGWGFTITDGEKLYAANTQAAGYVKEGDVVRYGDVYTIPAGFVGELYIPFNLYRGSTYGKPQILTFGYAEGEKPQTVTGKIYLECRTEQPEEAFLAVFSGWEYVKELPANTKADLSGLDLQKGDGDFEGGVSVSSITDRKANTAGGAPRVTLTPAEELDLASAALALRVKNLSSESYGFRVYMIGGGKTFVGQASLEYTLVDGETVSELTDNNRNCIVPAGFDGILVVQFADYATDNAAADLAQNVLRAGKVSSFNLYTAGNAEGVLFGKTAAMIGYDGTVTKFTVSTDTLKDSNASAEYEIGTVTAAAVTVDNADVELSADSVVYGVTEIKLTPKAGKLIRSVTPPAGATVSADADGGYTAVITRPLNAQETAYAFTAVTDDALTVSLSVGENGKAFYLGTPVESSLVVPAGESWLLTVLPDSGFGATVKADGEPVGLSEEGYLIPAGTQAVTVEFTRLTSKLTVTVGGHGTAAFGGEALSSGEKTVEQGMEYTLTVTPETGYIATVKLGGEILVPTENGYTMSILSDQTLEILFELAHYTITYELDRGVNGNNPATYTIEEEIVFAAPSKEGYDFLYWYVLDGGTERQITGIPSGSTGDLTVYAKFELRAETSQTEGGCGSVTLAGAGLFATAAFAAWIALRKKHD